MRQSDQPEIVTVVASPPAGVRAPAHNAFIDDTLRTLTSKKVASHRIVRAASIRDIDRELSAILTQQLGGCVKLQIVGHSLSGMLSLGALWMPEDKSLEALYQFPFYVLNTAPAALGLLAKFVGRFSEVMLVGCNVGSTASYGYAINGRTLTYTLAEVLQCLVRGADDVVGGDEFDDRGWYAPSAQHRRPKGWRWAESTPPVWTDRDPGTDPVRQGRQSTVVSFEIRSITSTLLPVPGFTQPIELDPAIHVACHQFAGKKPPTALAEVSIETDQGPAQLLCGGRFLKLSDSYYVVEKHPQLSSVLTHQLWRSGTQRTGNDEAAPAELASSAG